MGLIQILQSQVGPEFKRAKLQTQLVRSFEDLTSSRSLSEAEVTKSQLQRFRSAGSLRGCKTIIGEKLSADAFIEIEFLCSSCINSGFVRQPKSTVLMMVGQSGYMFVREFLSL